MKKKTQEEFASKKESKQAQETSAACIHVCVCERTSVFAFDFFVFRSAVPARSFSIYLYSQ
jgi:hypothetical protein